METLRPVTALTRFLTQLHPQVGVGVETMPLLTEIMAVLAAVQETEQAAQETPHL